MRAVLRVPRLTKEYHDSLQQSANPELELLEGIYENHYDIVAKE
jgi:hypothetical protein